MQAMLHFIYRDTLPDLEEHADLGEISDPSPCFRRVGVVVSAIQGPRLHFAYCNCAGELAAWAQVHLLPINHFPARGVCLLLISPMPVWETS